MTEPPGNRHALAFIFVTMLVGLGSLTSVAAPPLLSNLFGYFTSEAAPIYFPGAAFFAASLFLALSALMFAWSRRTPNPAQLKVGSD